MTSGKRNFISAAACVILAVPASRVYAQTPAQAAEQQAAQEAKLKAAMSASAYASFNAVVTNARQRGLPTDPLLAKGLEGIAKNVAADRIVMAVRVTADHLARAQTMIAATRPAASAEVIAVADALQRGIPEGALGRLIKDAATPGSLALSVYALADLTGNGVPVAVGLDVVGAWRAGGADPERLKQIPATIERLVRQGVTPARAGAGVAAGIRLGTPLLQITPANLPR